jgi:hypothetical protein
MTGAGDYRPRTLVTNEEGSTLPDLVCFCFEYSVNDIQEDVKVNNGRATILEEIVAAKKAGGCQCATTHPEGR